MNEQKIRPAAQEASRQLEICNACRYCEGYCAVFPAMTRQRAFAAGDISHMANLCHNCRSCYYACQYTEPHEFRINIPQAMAKVRTDDWCRHAWPAGFGPMFQKQAGTIYSLLAFCLFAFLLLLSSLSEYAGEGFYRYLSHGLMVLIFTPAFLLPLCSVAVSLRRYWRSVNGQRVSWSDLRSAIKSAATLRQLDGGHGEGCNFESEDQFSHTRRWFHQFTLYGFLACFAATSIATVYHYFLNYPAPYPLFSLPKLFGVIGGVALCVGCAGLAWLKHKAQCEPSDIEVRNSEFAFLILLFLVSATGLMLFAATGTDSVSPLLAVHLAFVMTFFLSLPYSKMVHGFYRMAALVREAQIQRTSAS